MRPTYQEELGRLEATYQQSLRLDIGALADLHALTAGQPALFVASGGGLASAQIAAERHTATHGELGVALTPLALVGEATVRRAAVVVISARAAHPDIGFALRAARVRHNYPVSLVTHRALDELDYSLLRRLTSAVHIPSLGRDGFLATNSVLSLATLFTRSSDVTIELPEALPWLSAEALPITTERCLVLHGPGQRAAAIDLETRLSELGLASVQVADYRNFAHGRHTGFARNVEVTTVISLASPATLDLANATMDALPAESATMHLHSSLPEPAAALDLLVASMRVVGATASSVGLDPARPKVPAFGRRLYHLGAQRHVALEPHGPIERKLAALRVPQSAELAQRYSDALDHWLADLESHDLRGIVIDYDGTVCTTSERFDLPSPDVQRQLLRLLDGGLHIGFATGRGRSLHADLRRWVPRPLWDSITLGLYNGSVMVESLNAPVPARGPVCGELATLISRLDDEPLRGSMKIEDRAGQISIEPVTGAGIGVEATAGWVSECIARAPGLALKSFRSGHSVDVVDAATSKVRVLEWLEHTLDGEVLAIGDRGDAGGNDFELLSARPWTLSVDRCSGDRTRCWNLAPVGASGPDALVFYLRRLQRQRSGWRFRSSDR
jgi:hypothetical protein